MTITTLSSDTILEEAKEYLHSLQYQRSFASLLHRYKRRLEKEIMFRASNQETDISSLFRQIAWEHDIPKEEYAVLPAMTSKKEKFKKKEKIINEDISYVDRERYKWEETCEDIQKQYRDVTDEVAKEEIEEKVMQRMQKEKEDLRIILKKIKKLSNIISNTTLQMLHIEIEVDELEKMYFKQVLRFYMKRLEDMYSQIFQKPVTIQYKTKEWMEHFENATNEYYREDEFIYEDSPFFEVRVLYALFKHRQDYTLLVSHEDYYFEVSKQQIKQTFAIKQKKFEYSENLEHEEAKRTFEERFNTFYHSQRAFYFLLETYTKLQKEHPDSPVLDSLRKDLQGYNPFVWKTHEVFKEEQRQVKALEKKYWEGHREEVQTRATIEEAFPFLTFHTEEKENKIIKSLLSSSSKKEGRYKDMYTANMLYTIENKEQNLSFSL